MILTISKNSFTVFSQVIKSCVQLTPSTVSYRSPFSNQHVNGGLIRPPFLRLPTLTIPPSPNVGAQSQPQPPTRTRLKPESASSSPSAHDIGLGSVHEHRDGTRNELEGPALSSKVEPSEAPPGQDITMTLVPVAAVLVLVLGLSMSVWSLRRRICASRKSKESVSFVGSFLFFVYLYSKSGGNKRFFIIPVEGNFDLLCFLNGFFESSVLCNKYMINNSF